MGRWGRKRQEYHADMERMMNGGEAPALLRPVSFLKLLLDRDGIDEGKFCELLGYQSSYLANLMGSGSNRGTHALPKPLAQKLHIMTGLGVTFWQFKSYHPDLADKVEFDLDADLSTIISESNYKGRVAQSPGKETKR